MADGTLRNANSHNNLMGGGRPGWAAQRCTPSPSFHSRHIVQDGLGLLSRTPAADSRTMPLLRVLVVLTAIVCASCGGGDDRPSTPTAPSPPPPPAVPACQTNSTFTLAFGNRSPTLTYDVSLNDIRVATITPGQDSPSQNAAANVPNRVVFRVTNNGAIACQGSPIYTPCDNRIVTCG